MVKQYNTFTNARTTLTLWYCAILFFILSAFSIVLYTTETGNFARVVLQRNFGGTIPRRLSNLELRELGAQLRALRTSFIFDLIVIDGVILFIGGGLSYFLAGKTLLPIQDALKKQKTFVADASHELRTPLASIQTACEVVLRSSAKTKEDYKKVVQQVFDETKRVSKLANDLLLLSRIDAGPVMHREKISLDSIVQEALEQTKSVIIANKLLLTKTITEEVLIQGDKDRIKQLVLILLDNAIKYTPEKGRIMVTVTKTPKPILTISDTGRGISPEQQKQIFNRFYQTDSSRANTGAGLGLAIAKSIADAHGAVIKVESKVGSGSRFSVVFPVI